jgi:hypothetical protein
MRPQSRGSPNVDNFGTPIRESRDKKPFGCGPAERCKVNYMGEGDGFPQARAVVSFVSPKSPVARPSTKNAPTMY